MTQWLVRRGLLAALPVASLVVAFSACSSEPVAPGPGTETAEKSGAGDQEIAATPHAAERVTRLSRQFTRMPVQPKAAFSMPAGVQPPLDPIKPVVLEPRAIISKGEATRFLQAAGRVRAEVPPQVKTTTPTSASVELPVKADGFVRIQPDRTGIGVEFATKGVHKHVDIEVADGVAMYPGAVPGDADLLMRVTKNSVEDFIVFKTKPSLTHIDYTVNVSEVAGLRLIGNGLEFVAKNGSPQIRVSPPELIDADGATHMAQVAILDCAVDTNGEAPWDHPPVPPGAAQCTMRVSWNDAKVVYPAILDPVWATADQLNTARFQNAAVRLTNGRTLTCGGLSTSGEATATCEVFNPTGGIAGEGDWANVTSMGTARSNFNLILHPPTTHVVAVGGDNIYTSERYNLTSWTAGIGDYSAMSCVTCTTNIPAMTSDGAYVVTMGYYGYPYVLSMANNTWYAGTTHAAPVASFRYSAQVIAIPGQNTIMRVGGYWYNPGVIYLKSAERYRPNVDPVLVGGGLNPWTTPGEAASMSTLRGSPAVMTLDGNRLMVYGGSNATGSSSTAEIYTASTNTWADTTGSMPNGNSATQYYLGRTFALHTGSGKFLLSPDNGGPYIYDPTAQTFLRINTGAYQFGSYQSQGNVTQSGAKVLMVPVQPQGTSGAQKDCRLFDFGDKGSFCSTSAECQAGLSCVYDQYGNYIDGNSVCCDSACDTPCVSCRAGNKQSNAADGTCGGRKTDQYIGSNNCAYTDPSSCGTTGGYCDGNGACAKWSSTTVCEYGSCLDDNTQNNDRLCDGNGTCLAAATTDCSDGFACLGSQCVSGGLCYSDQYCSSDYYCQYWSPPAGSVQTCQPKKANGAACNYSHSECESNHCVDGVCCDDACNGTCEACINSLTGKTTGSCEPITAASGPAYNDCYDQQAYSCGWTGLCDGAGACQVYAANTQCADVGSCASQTARYIPDTCDGAGACDDKGTQNCATGYSCQNGVCATQCTSDANCSSGYWCETVSKVCTLDRSQGQSCARDSMCSGNINCVEGVCCNSACGSDCQSCLQTNTNSPDGTCANVLDDIDPKNRCAIGAAYPNSCAAPGLCNGQGACRPYAKLTVECDPDVCTDATLTTYECNGAGTCKPKAVQCYPFKCDTTSNVCRVACSLDAHCVEGSSCENGTCVGQLENGSSCTRGPQCKTGFCANVGEGVLAGEDTGEGGAGAGGAAGDPGDDSPGVCCDEACQGTCSGCKASIKGFGSDGICEFVKNNTDPADDCEPAVGDQCGLDGQCNGSGACRLAPSGTSCGASSCQGNSLIGESCNGQGDCIANQGGVDCGAFKCREVNTVFECNSCTTDNDCSEGHYCQDTTCFRKLANGKACETSGVCDSGYCIDGVCCDASCNGQCEACDSPGSEGVCVAVQGEPHGNRAKCDHAGEECGGACDGVNAAACKYAVSGSACGEATCTNAIADSSACDGAGSCRANDPERCSPYTCGDDDACLSLCETDDDCTQGYTCDEGAQQCVPAAVAAECSEDRQSSVGNNGISTPCKPFLCVPASGTCAVSCAFTTDCAPEFVCEASTKTCLPAPPDSGAGEEEGCACRAAGAPSPGSSSYFSLAALGLALTALRRRRKEKSPTSPRSRDASSQA